MQHCAGPARHPEEPFWIGVRNDQVVKIAQPWLPQAPETDRPGRGSLPPRGEGPMPDGSASARLERRGGKEPTLAPRQPIILVVSEDPEAAPAPTLGGGVRSPGRWRPCPRPTWRELDQDESRRLLAGRHLGRLAVPDFGGPMIFPVNYVVEEDLVVFRTDLGSKLDAATERESVALEVDAIDEATRTGWSGMCACGGSTSAAAASRSPRTSPPPGGTEGRSRPLARPLRPGRLLAVEGCVRYRRPQHRFTVDWIVHGRACPSAAGVTRAGVTDTSETTGGGTTS